MMSKIFLILGIIFITSAGCGQIKTLMRQSTGQANPSTSQPVPAENNLAKQTLTVFAAASLTGAFQEIGENFEKANPGVVVNFNFASSRILRAQIEQGAVIDVFASADHENMDVLLSNNLLVENTYQDFATNKLIMIMPSDNPGSIQSLADLTKPDVKIILADPSAPAGNYARQVLLRMSEDADFGADFNTSVLANVVSYETDVKQVVTKVELGEADAGFVYVSDAIATPDLITFPIPERYNVIADYPIAILSDAPETKLASEFIAAIMSTNGQAILMRWGFSPVR